MAKRKETLELESILHHMCQKKRLYGCEEVTIGFHNNGHGNEVVDFCTMNSKGELRCYEIKVTLSDLKSKAKKSWYGHYNYLFVTGELYQKIWDKLDEFVPVHVGVAVPYDASWSNGIEIVKNAKKQALTEEQEVMLKESLVRSMYHKMNKYKEAADIQAMSRLKSQLRKSDAECKKYCDEASNLRWLVSRMERALRLYYGWEVNLEEIMLQISERKLKLPECLKFTLTQRGNEYNKQVEAFKDLE